MYLVVPSFFLLLVAVAVVAVVAVGHRVFVEFVDWPRRRSSV